MNSKKFGNGCAKVLSAISRCTTTVFISLRACDVIDWNWYWVLSPFLITAILGILGFAVKGAEAVNSEKNES